MIKKKIGDLTLIECKKICQHRDTECQGCPLCSVCYTLQENGFCDLEYMGNTLDKEVEVEENG